MNKYYRISLLTLCVLATMALSSAVVKADIATYTANLAGANEVPPVATAATGVATITINTDTTPINAIPFQMTFSGLSSPQTGAHIHQGAPGTNGGVVVPLPLGSPVNTTVALTLPTFAALVGGNLYVNVHSQNFPGGEIRGQLLLTGTVAEDQSSWGSIKALFR